MKLKEMNPKALMLVAAIMLTTWAGYAQKNRPGREKIEAAKIGLISERLNLTTEEAERFWPIYNEYSRKREANHRAFKEARRDFDPDNASDEETRSMLKLGRETKEKQLRLEQEYSERMLNVINSRQLLSLQEAEREFRDILLERLRQRRQEGGGLDRQREFRQENNDRLRQRRNN